MMYKPTMSDRVPILRLIELAGGDVDIVQGCDQDTLLRVAVDYCSIKAIRFYIQHNVRANARSLSGDEDGREGTTICTGFLLASFVQGRQAELKKLQKYLECD